MGDVVNLAMVNAPGARQSSPASVEQRVRRGRVHSGARRTSTRASGRLSTGVGERGRIVGPSSLPRGSPSPEPYGAWARAERRAGGPCRGLGQELLRVVSESLRRATKSGVPSKDWWRFALAVNGNEELDWPQKTPDRPGARETK